MNKKVTIYSTAIPVQKLTPHNDIKHVELLSTAISSCENSFWHVLIKQIKQLNEAELKTLQVCLVCSSFCPPPGITMLNGNHTYSSLPKSGPPDLHASLAERTEECYIPFGLRPFIWFSQNTPPTVKKLFLNNNFNDTLIAFFE